MEVNFCYKTATVWQFVGQVLFVLKILIPIAIIIFASIDLGKAAISSDDKAVKNASIKLIKRIIAGVCIFFVPTVIQALFSLVTLISEDMRNDYKNCINCLTNPSSKCDVSYKGEIFKK